MRIKDSMLEEKCDLINSLLEVEKIPWKDGKSNVGTHFICRSNYSYQLLKMCNQSGGVNEVFSGPNKSILYLKMVTFIEGILAWRTRHEEE
jgi:hypothetical protein